MLTLALAFSSLASASDCDLKSLRKDLDAASPVALPALYEKLIACDRAEAVKQTPKVFERVLGGGEGYGAALKAIEIDAGGSVRTWLGRLEPDQRSAAVAWLGERCATSEPVQKFFLAAHADKGLDFFTERWHRGLTDCRTDGVRQILSAAIVNKDLARNRSQLFNVLEVYARNLRADALPGLVALANATSDAEELTYLINAFADAAGVGSVAGVDGETSRKAAQAIAGLGPKLPERAVEQARTTLTALGAEADADRMATHRWRDRKDPSGNYRYAVAVLESVACKNNKTSGTLHYAPFSDDGSMWPKQLQEELRDKLEAQWSLTAAAKCKGTGELTVAMPDEPFVSDEERTKWIDAQLKAFNERAGSFDKSRALKREPFAY
jgi:hypothetical protein